MQSFPNGNVGTNPVPGLGTFTVNFTGPVPFGPGVDIFGERQPRRCRRSPSSAWIQHMRTPYVQSYNFNIQQTLVEGTVLQVGYVGSKGTKLFRVRDINQATAGPVETLQQRRPFNYHLPAVRRHLSIGSLRQRQLQRAAGCAAQAALQGPDAVRFACLVALHRRCVQRHLLLHGRSVAAAEQFRYARREGGLRLRPAPALHGELRSTTWTSSPRVLNKWPRRLTEGWQLSGIYTLGSGLPITPFWNGAAPSGSGESSNDRPNVVGNPNNGPKRSDAWFNTAAFVAAPAGHLRQRRAQYGDRTAHQHRPISRVVKSTRIRRAASICSSAPSSSISSTIRTSRCRT